MLYSPLNQIFGGMANTAHLQHLVQQTSAYPPLDCVIDRVGKLRCLKQLFRFKVFFMIFDVF